MNLFEDILLVNKRTFKKSVKSFRNNWILIFTGIVYGFINMALTLLISTFFTGILSFLAGLVVAIASSSLISNYLYLLFNIINYDKITWADFKEGFKFFFWKVYGIFFIFWLGSFLLSAFVEVIGVNPQLLATIVTVLVIVGLNPLPETVYQKTLSSGESIGYALEFMKDNWINWLIPNVAFNILIYLLTNNWAIKMFSTHLNFNFDISIKGIIFYIFSQCLFSFMMIYRGHLFKLLSTSTPRKRMYISKFYD